SLYFISTAVPVYCATPAPPPRRSSDLLTLVIHGWLPQEALAVARERHFYHLEPAAPTPERWQIETDNHVFTLFWAAIDNLPTIVDRKSTRLNSSHVKISYAVFCLKKKK